MLIGYWDPDTMMFIVDGKRVSFGVEDIYFMIGLSHRGEKVNLHGGIQIEGALTIHKYIDVYCEAETEKVVS